MDGQVPPNWPRYHLTRTLIGLDNKKKCYDVTMTRQERKYDTTSGEYTGGPACL